MSRNDITGDSLTTRVPTDKYRDGWDRIFGHPQPCANHDWSSDGDPGPGENMTVQCMRCGLVAELRPAPPYRCVYCGAPSWVHPCDQEPPPEYCHESDHGEPQ